MKPKRPFLKRTPEQHIKLHEFIIANAKKEIEVQQQIITASQKDIERLKKKHDIS